MIDRTARHHPLSQRLGACSEEELVALLLNTPPRRGFGTNRVVSIDGAPVFVKSVPLTGREADRPGCTANLFGLPTFYNYGVGSAGFGAHRELAMHLKTTAWVLDGAIDTFPLLHHHRVVPTFENAPRTPDDELDAYVESWDGSDAVREYTSARIDAPSRILLFLEHIPHTLRGWLRSNRQELPRVLADMQRTLSFLGANGVVHFDAHLDNIVTDGQRFFLSDFGLVLDRSFELDAAEVDFLEAHWNYDAGEFITGLYDPLFRAVEAWGDSKKEAMERRFGGSDGRRLVRHVAELCEDGELDLPDSYRDVLVRYAGVAEVMVKLFEALHAGPKRDVVYDDAEVGRRLVQAGWMEP